MIEINKVNKKYIKGSYILEDINLEIPNGKIFGFIGPNGAGKTTLIKMINGILKVDEGTIKIDEYNIGIDDLKAKKQLGFVPDNADIFLNLKGIEYLNFIADMYEVPEKKRIVNIKKYAEIFNMMESLDEKIQNYSHGMRQKIVIIGALVHEPQNLVLDEPITGLDPKAIYDLKQILKEYVQNGKCVFFSTHIIEIAEKMCDEIAIINKGKILFKGKPDDLIEKNNKGQSLEEIFMELISDE